MSTYISMPAPPHILTRALFIARLLPGITMLLVASVLVSTDMPSAFFSWIETTYNLSVENFGGIMLATGVVAIIWPLTSKGIIRAPLIDAIGILVLTFPLWLFIGLIFYYTTTVIVATGTGIAFQASLFLAQVVIYFVSCGFRLWQSQLAVWMERYRAAQSREGG